MVRQYACFSFSACSYDGNILEYISGSWYPPMYRFLADGLHRMIRSTCLASFDVFCTSSLGPIEKCSLYIGHT
jgi:hypothetical protein